MCLEPTQISQILEDYLSCERLGSNEDRKEYTSLRTSPQMFLCYITRKYVGDVMDLAAIYIQISKCHLLRDLD